MLVELVEVQFGIGGWAASFEKNGIKVEVLRTIFNIGVLKARLRQLFSDI